MSTTTTDAVRRPAAMRPLARLLSKLWGASPDPEIKRQRPRLKLETLEPRILLSADFAPEAADAMAAGLDQLGERMDNFLSGDEAIGQRVPLLLKVTGEEDGTLLSESPTIGDLLAVPVDANGDGDIDSVFFGDEDESTLFNLDSDSDGRVDAGEFLEGWFFEPVRQFLNGVDPGDSTGTFVDFLTGFGFFFGLDQTLDDLGGAYTVQFEITGAADGTEDPDAEVIFSVGFSLTVSQSMPIDLGLEADGLKLFAFTGDPLAPGPVEVPVVSTLSFAFEFGVLTGGQDETEIDESDFFVRRADPMVLSVVAEDADLNFNLNVGFLGAQVVHGNFDLQADVETTLVDPDDPEVLGFTDSQHGDEQTSGVVIANNELDSPDLAHDAGFFLRIGNVGIATPVTVDDLNAADTTALKGHIQAALDDAGLGELIEADIIGGKVRFSLVDTSDTPLGFGNESLALNGILEATPDGNGASDFDFLADQTFLLSVGGALARLVTVRFPDPAKDELGFNDGQEAALSGPLVAPNAPSVLDVTGDANIDVTVTLSNGMQHQASIVLTATETDGIGGVAQLAALIDSQFSGTDVYDNVIVGVSDGKLEWSIFNNAPVAAIRVEASGTAVTELGLAADAVVTSRVVAANNAISTADLTSTATFEITVTTVGAGTTTKRIDVTPSSNASIVDLAADVDAALGAAGLAIDAVADGSKIVLVAQNEDVAAFELSVVNKDIDDLVHDVNLALEDAGLGSQVNASNAGGKLRLTTTGGESIEITKTLTFDAGVTFGELLAPAEELFAPQTGSASHATLDLPVEVLDGLEDGVTGADDHWKPENVAIVANFSPLDLDSPAVDYDEAANRFTLHLTLDPEMDDQDSPVDAVPDSGDLTEEVRLVNFAELLNFNLLGAENMVGLLMGLGSALQQLASLPEFANYDIPFADASLADLLNFTDSDKEAFSGLIDRLIFDTGGDGVDGAADAERLLRKVDLNGTSYLVPAFVTAQGLGTKLEELLGVALEGDGGINPTYNWQTNELTYQVDLVADDATATSDLVAFEYDVDLAPFAKLTVDAAAQPADKQVTLEGRTGLAMTFGIDLSPPGIVITGDMDLDQLNGGNGVSIRQTEAITGTVEIDVVEAPGLGNPALPPVPQLSGNAVFSIELNDNGSPVEVTIAAASAVNRSMGDLVVDVNKALANAGLAGELEADFDGRYLVIAARHEATEFAITASNDVATNELGLAVGAESNKVDFVITDRAGNTHAIELDGLPADPNVQDVIDAINAQTGGAVIADFNGAHTGLRLIDDTGGSGLFRVDSVNGSDALLGLGFFRAGNDNSESQFVQDNGDPNVIVGGALGETQLDDRFFLRDAELRIDGLTVTTNDGGVPGTALFGIVGVDTNIDGSFVANVTADLKGGGDVTLAELFRKTGVLDDPVVSKAHELAVSPVIGTFEAGDVIIGGTSGATAVVVKVDGNTLTLSNIEGSFDDGEIITDRDLESGAFAAGSETQNGVFGTFDLAVDVQPGFNEFGFGDDIIAALDGQSYNVPIELTGFGNPVSDIAPVAELDLSGIGHLAAFEHLSYSHLADVLHELLALVEDVNLQFDLFNTPLPAINKSIADLLSLVEGFERSVGNADFVLDAADEAIQPEGLDLPALTLQNIPQALRGAFGLPNDVDPDASGAVDWVRLEYDDADNLLLLDLSLNESLSTKLGLDIDVGEGLPKLTSGGVLKVSGSLDINLNVGIDLEAPQNAYLFDTSSIAAEMHVIGEGQEYDTGEDGAGLVFHASLGPLAVFIQDGDARIDVAFALPGLDFGMDDRRLIGDVVFEDFNDPAISENEVSVVLPMFYGGESVDDFIGDFSATGELSEADPLDVQTPDFSSIADDITNEVIAFDPFDNISLAIDTLNIYLESLSDLFASEILSLPLPFIGDQMADVLFIEEFRHTLVGALKAGVENAINPDPDVFVGDLLADLFGVGGALEGYLESDIDEFENVGEGAAIADWRRQWNFTVGHTDVLTIDDFVIGLGELEFDVDMPVTVTFDWSFALGFGVNFGESAFIDVSHATELELDIDITLPGGTYTGELGYLRVNAEPGNPGGGTVSFDVDVQNQVAPSGGRLGFSDIGSIEALATVGGSAAATFDLVTQFMPGLPELSTELEFEWQLASTSLESLDGDAVAAGLERLALNDMAIDPVSVAKQLLGPIFDEVSGFIEPFMPVVDTLTAPIPILSDIAGEPFTLLDLAGIFATSPPQTEFFETVADILDVIVAVNDFITSPALPLGDLVLYDRSEGIFNFDPTDESKDSLEEVAISGAMPGLTLDPGFDETIEQVGFLKKLRDGEIAGGLDMPILTDPLAGIHMLNNQIADLVSFPLKPLSVDFEYFQAFPVFGPLSVGIEIGFGFMLDLHKVGFDTFGYKRFAEGGFRNPFLVFDGFFLGDLDENKVDAPEVTMLFSLVGTAELNLGIARAGVGGGIDAVITFDWHDSIADGNVHISEILGNIFAEDGNPLAPFDVGGALTFEMFAFLEILSFRKDIPITPITELYSFEDTTARDPVLATKADGTLILNMGVNAVDRLNGDTSDGHEEFFVKYEDGKVKVWSDKLGVGEGDAQEFEGITHIVGLGGQGNDVIELRGFDDSTITGEFDGGVGDDRIEYVGSTASGDSPGARITGGLGNDTLTGGHLNDVIYGGEGNDTIKGGGGYDILFGDQGRVASTLTPSFISSRITAADGDDKIEGGDADDVIFGGGGNDELKGDAGTDVLIGDGGRFEYTTTGGHVNVAALRPAAYVPTPVTNPVDPEQISADIDAVYDAMVATFVATDLGFGGNDTIFGGAHGDLILGGSGDDTVDGEGGDDIILGGKGFDHLKGGADNDTMFGGDQADTMLGNDGDDVMSGGSGNDLMHGNAGNDVMKGDTGADVMFGDEDDDQVFGLTEPDILFGGAGNDLVVGGTGNDTMFGDDGLVAKIDPASGDPDKLIGIGNPMLAAGAFHDDDIRTTDLIVTDVRDDDGNDILSGQAGEDIMLGGGGDDLMGGDVDPRLATFPRPSEISDDVLIGDGGKVVFDQRRFRSIETVIGTDTTGEPFDDVIYGDNGNDYIFGGRGNDFLFGGHGKVVDMTTWALGASRGPTDAEASDNDIILGDNGEMLFADDTVLGNFGVLERVHTTDSSEDTGGHDWAEGELGEDVIFGGVNGSPAGVDTLFGHAGNDVVLGDNGELDWDFDGADDLTTLDLIRSALDGRGGMDVVSGNAGDDVLIGGTAGDEMYGDDANASAGLLDGEDIMLGDNADIFLIGNAGRLLVRVADMEQATAVDRIMTTDTSDAFGGADTMSGNAKADVMLGGVNAGGVDTMYGDRAAPTMSTIANDGDDILLGDNGELDFTFDPDADRTTLDLIRSYEDGLGGMDVISGNKGLDVAIGGTAGDEIYGDDAAASAADADLGDLLLGDNADVFLVAKGAAVGGDLKVVLDAAVMTIRTTDEEHPEHGGADTISGNAGGDVIAGGVDGDTLYGDALAVVPALDGDDIILGDNGAFEWLSTGRLDEIEGIDIEANNALLWEKYGESEKDEDLTTLDLVTTEQPTSGGRDTIFGDEGNDLVFGGTDLDVIHGDDGDEMAAIMGSANRDVLFGDHGRLYPQFSVLNDFHSRNFFAIDTGDADGGEGDIMYGEEGDDVMLGQQGDDRMWGGSHADDMIGGHNVEGGIDELSAPAVDITVGSAGMNDLMDGGSGNDAMKGDNVIVWRRGDDLSPRFRQLTAASLYSTTDSTITTNVGGEAQSDPNDTVGRDIEVLDHSDDVEAAPGGRFGDDLMAGGADDDLMLGDLGDDILQGDGSIGSVADEGPNTLTADVADAGGDTDEVLYFNVPEAETDGDDYIEGSGGDDLIYGGLGQDDLIGGSSSLFGLDTEEERPDGSDIIFGGAGATARLERNDFVGASDTDQGTAEGVGAVPTDDDPQIALADRHSRDADFIMGDNANVFRIVDAADAYREFNYDQSGVENRGEERIVVRAMQQLDYTLGGADFAGGAYASGAANADNGAADLIHGESGDDYIFGMTGSDVLFGESDDDDIVGGYGNDWISGGTGQDGVLGDDGLLYTSRNSTQGEPLYGVAGLLAADPSAKYNNGTVLNEVISTPGDIQWAQINVAGELKKAADLVPFSFDSTWMAQDDEFPDDATNKPFADDIIFGGLGGDFLHGGSGDDAISGAEALEHAYVPTFGMDGQPDGILDLGYDSAHLNPGDVLAFNPQDLDGQHLNNRFRAGEFFLYDEYDPLRRIELTAGGELWKPGDGPSFQFLLNFDETEGVWRASGTVPKATGQQTPNYPEVNDDGKDAIFGDLGNDWLVGGTGRDNLYGGWGNDLLNVDDDLTTLGDAPKHGDPQVEGANDRPDTHPFYEDRAYGGAGRDILIANTGGDRLIDWVGEYNSYLVPFAPFGQATVSRTMMPHLHEFLYALSAGDGADFTRYADTIGGTPPAPTNNDPIPSRNGEPAGELGLVLQKDFAWGDQTGAPADPQAGNIPGGHRDVLRSAGFQDGTMEGFFVDTGSFSVEGAKLQVAANSTYGDAVSVYHVGDALPSYFEIQATVTTVKATGGWKANAYVIFDYIDDSDFKFAGIDDSSNKLVIGHRESWGWAIDKHVPIQAKHDTLYNVLVAVNGVNVTVVVDNKLSVSYTFQPRVIDGFSHGLNYGLVGVGSDSSRGTYDNIAVKVLPPQITYQAAEGFDAPSALFPAHAQLGAWTVTPGGRFTGAPAAGETAATALMDLGVNGLYLESMLELSATVNTAGVAGFVFDRYSAEDFKFVALDAASGQVILGHHTEENGWTTDLAFDRAIAAGTDQQLGVVLNGPSVTVKLGGQTIGSHFYNAVIVDGDFGLLAAGGPAAFDDLVVKTNDAGFVPAAGAAMMAASAGEGTTLTLTQAELDATAADPRLASVADARFEVADLAGLALAVTNGRTVLVDRDAAGHGWFVDASSADNSEFRIRLDDNVFKAARGSEAYGRMDLFTVLAHEVGHLMGFEHADAAAHPVMREELAAGVRYVAAEPERVEAPAPAPVLDWSVDGGAWSPDFATPWTSPAALASQNFADYLVTFDALLGRRKPAL